MLFSRSARSGFTITYYLLPGTKQSAIIIAATVKMNEPVQKTEKRVILGLVGSPRKLGNCEVMVKEIWRNVEPEHTLRLIRMPSLHVKPCNACYRCIAGMSCPHKDDVDFLLDQITEADGVIIASPVYFLGAHSIFKQILDRGFLFYRVLRETFGTPCILLNLYGMDNRVGVSSHTLRSFASCLGLDIKADVNMKAALPGEVLLEEEAQSTAKALAQQLYSRKKEARGRGCPFCGCSIVRMEETGFTCALCHGSFALDGAGMVIPLKEGGMFGSADHMLLHKDWLGSMKQQFLDRRREILKTTLPYKDMGEWVLPHKE
jgi:NAD(P)H-dependent FMN reductase